MADAGQVRVIHELFGPRGSLVAYFSGLLDVRRYEQPKQVCDAVLEMFRRVPAASAIRYITKQTAIVDGFPRRVVGYTHEAPRTVVNELDSWSFVAFFQQNQDLYVSQPNCVILVVIYVVCYLFAWAETSMYLLGFSFDRVRGSIEYLTNYIRGFGLDGGEYLRDTEFTAFFNDHLLQYRPPEPENPPE